jgi:hypothetical protein
MLVDNVDLTSDDGWKFLKNIAPCPRMRGLRRSARLRHRRSWKPISGVRALKKLGSTGPVFGQSRMVESALERSVEGQQLLTHCELRAYPLIEPQIE